MSVIVRAPCDEGVIRAARASTPVAAPHWTLVAAILGSSMAFMDGTIATVALPAISRDLSASVAQLQWVVEAYALLLSSLVLVGGSLGDQFGRRRIFGIGVGTFAAASVGCGMSQTIAQLIALRALQGFGAALLHLRVGLFADDLVARRLRQQIFAGRHIGGQDLVVTPLRAARDG